MEQTKRYPVSLDTVQKGRVFPPKEIEYLTGAKQGTPEYSFALLNLRTQIEISLIAAGRTPLTIKCEKDCLRILTDTEAAEYNAKMFNQLQMRAAKRFALQIAVDVGSLTTEQRTAHERNCLVNGKILQAVGNVRKQFKLQPYTRKTPLLTVDDNDSLG